jgi:plastocyanin
MATSIGNVRQPRWEILVRLGAVVALVLMALAADASVGSAGGAATTGLTVKIVNGGGTCTSLFCYKPGKIFINSGTTVTWINMTNASHTVTRCTLTACGVGGGTGRDTGFGSGTIAPGGSYRFTFDGKGSYVYYCAIHGYSVMHARVIEVT